jgi:glycerol-3-phosphate dehydrogenase
MTNKTYDVAIVGGGIHGAGIAQACAAAGYTCIIIEKDQWAAGTSQKSSKLIHGGLRYLESAQFSLVRESLRERNILL